MIIKLTIRKVLCLCVLCAVGTVNSSMRGMKLCFGLFAGAGFAWQKVKIKGTLPSEKNKFRNSDGLSAWSKVSLRDKSIDTHVKMVEKRQKAVKFLPKLLEKTNTPGDMSKIFAAFKSFWKELDVIKADIDLGIGVLKPSNDSHMRTINRKIESCAKLRSTPAEQKKFKDSLMEATAKNKYCKSEVIGGVKRVALDDSTLNGLTDRASIQANLMHMNASLAIIEHDLEIRHDPIYEIINSSSSDKALLEKGLSDLDALAQGESWNEENLLCEDFDGDYEPQPTNFFRTLDLSANLMAMFDMTDMFKMGVSFSVGYSFRELQLKDTPITINESLMAKIALVLGVTDFLQLHLGVGLVKREVGIKKYEDWDKDYGSVKNLVNNPMTSRFGADGTNQGIDPDDTCDHIAIYGFGAVVLKYPVSEIFDVCLSIGLQRDINDFNGDLGGVTPNLEMAPMAHGTLGIGLLFKA